ncbi:YetF domain-containing protein [Mucilaginibacter celer]|uniref:DUF421 domain-containing protein n=1 Tax=Mucilaginibacter celer TaxID=2305508 RepID=A0A494VU85_9SPHI|nr:YetF domain-containing protein [Mucilaginibacter celer]AYL99157.1 DUF421 domain-containing protein [Mucilaginibacter celer]
MLSRYRFVAPAFRLVCGEIGKFSHWTEGNKFLLFHDGKFDHEEMRRALVCKEDVMQGIRRSALTTDMDTIDKVYMERNGEVSVIRKKG